MTLAVVILGLVTLQRLVELVLARRNTMRLQAKGGYEIGAEQYPWIVALHAAWLAGLWYAVLWLGQVDVHPIWLAVFVGLQVLRLWVMASLGERWTTRIIIVPGAPLVAGGPYRFLRHPNYCVVAAEILVLPLTFGLVWFGAAFSLLNALVLLRRIRAEDAALREPRSPWYSEAGAAGTMKDPNRFWWLKLVLIAASAIGMWYFERALFPQNGGFLGAGIGLVLGACFAVIYEDYLDRKG